MGKETVLALLLREKGHFVSGEAVSAELGITRAAIWKSISALRAQGYEIDAVTGRGYCLKSLPDTLTEQTVRSYLGPVETVGKRIDCFDSIDSTNAYLKRIALDGAPDGTVAVAAEHLVAVPARHAVGLLNHAGRVLGQELAFGQRHQMPLDLGRRGRTGNQKQIRSADFQHFLQDFRQFHGHSSPAASNSRSSPSGSPSSVTRRYTALT